MRPVAILTITGLVGLVVAVLTGSTPLAVLVVGVAITGIVLLLRDWRDERKHSRVVAPHQVADEAEPGLTADRFSPDISTSPDGPSSNARAD